MIIHWILNFAISWFNAWGVGKTWTETRAVGGPAHFMSWMGATMSAVGFTWCYMVILGYVATLTPETMLTEDGDPNVMLLDPVQASAFFDLAYLVIIFPLIGSGAAIMTHSWGVFWRHRSLSSGVTAGWNTYANLSNFYHAAEHVPVAFDNVGGFFDSSSSDDGKGKLVVALVAVAVVGGVLTSWAIIRHTARETARARRFKYEFEADHGH